MKIKKIIDFLKQKLRNRNTIQMLATLLTNIHISNFLKGTIYTGKLKQVCVPGLNCYSCPGATGACPVGSFQAVVGSSKFSFSYYITGILIFFGVIFGRFICGFLCPFGWVQDLLHKIPSKKISTAKLKVLRYLKYVILVIAVCILPILLTNEVGMATPYFCKYICPQGVLGGSIPLSLADSNIASALGPLFSWKVGILLAVVIGSIFFYRPFCKWLCPLGAFYSLFNKVSLLNYSIDQSKCVSCHKCTRVCKMDVDITKSTSALECIRCGECVKACPTQAIKICWGKEKTTKQKTKGEK